MWLIACAMLHKTLYFEVLTICSIIFTMCSKAQIIYSVSHTMCFIAQIVCYIAMYSVK